MSILFALVIAATGVVSQSASSASAPFANNAAVAQAATDVRMLYFE